MTRFLTMKRLSLLFFSIFGVLVAGTLLVQRFWIAPAERCEKGGQWWYAAEGRCVTPIYIPDITKRAPGVSRAEASNEQNRELLTIEARLKAEKAARDAATAREREEFARSRGL